MEMNLKLAIKSDKDFVTYALSKKLEDLRLEIIELGKEDTRLKIAAQVLSGIAAHYSNVPDQKTVETALQYTDELLKQINAK